MSSEFRMSVHLPKLGQLGEGVYTMDPHYKGTQSENE